MDDSPPWILAINKIQLPIWIKLIEILKLDKLIDKLRRDTKTVPTTQRESTIDGLALLSVMQRIRRRDYSTRRVLKSKLLAIEDVGFNSILIRNNHHLEKIAKELNEQLPEKLTESFKKATKALDQLWQDDGQTFYSRNYYNKESIQIESIASLLPLYSGVISQDQADLLAKKMQNDIKFDAKYPVPSMSKDSGHYDPKRFWQGPSWVNTNWFLIDGLERYGHTKQAEQLRKLTIDMVSGGGFYEYFSPDSGKPEGAKNFSWTAALIIDLSAS
jgi:glycogen debranching enzyme